MAYTKRVALATAFGIVAGIICWLLSKGIVDYTLPMVVGTVMSRAMIGFGIGISGWKKIDYRLHGALLGLVFTIPLAALADPTGAVMLLVAGTAYGLVIEFLVTNVFKTPMK